MKKINLTCEVEIPASITEIQFYEQFNKWLSEMECRYVDTDTKVPAHLELQRAHHEAVWDSIKAPQERYSLRKTWSSLGKKVSILMMNPSYAGAITSDDTVNFMTEYAANHFKAGSIWIVNMSPFINPKSKKLSKSHFSFNSDNFEMIKQAIHWSDIVFLAWGTQGHQGYVVVKQKLLPLLVLEDKKYYCFRQGERGIPIHKNSWRDKIDISTAPRPFDPALLN